MTYVALGALAWQFEVARPGTSAAGGGFPFAVDLADLDAAFRDRLARADRAWAAIAFEAVYLGAWLCFVSGRWPLRVHWRWRIVLAPVLLFGPYFLGYAPGSLTYGPSGGFVYPGYLLVAVLPMVPLPCVALDAVLWQRLPMVLSRLSMMPGSPVGAASMACVGPVSTLVFGIALLLSSVVVVVARRRMARGTRTLPPTADERAR